MTTAELVREAEALRGAILRKPVRPQWTGERVVLADLEHGSAMVLDRYDDGRWRRVPHGFHRSAWTALVEHGALEIVTHVDGVIESEPSDRERTVARSLGYAKVEGRNQIRMGEWDGESIYAR